MDVLLAFCDQHFFTPYVYPTSWAEDNILRQFLTLNIITDVAGALFYLITASLNYIFVYDKRLLKHPLMLENQIQKEISLTLRSVPGMGVLTCILFLLEVRGYSRLYDSVHDSKHGWWTIAGSAVAFLMFTDCLIYFIHRGLHHKLVYKHFHKYHHLWKVPTPFASHAFHPLDGFLQSVPYHMYVFLFPMHKFTYLSLYMFVNVWTVSIHDAEYRVPDILKPIVNGAAHHTDHHLFYNYNYGQYFTLWDRLCGSFRTPAAWDGKGPIDTINKLPHPGYGENEDDMESSAHANSKADVSPANSKAEVSSAAHKRRSANGHTNAG